MRIQLAMSDLFFAFVFAEEASEEGPLEDIAKHFQALMRECGARNVPTVEALCEDYQRRV